MTTTDSKNARRSTAAIWIVNIGLLLIMAGIAMPLLRTGAGIYNYIFSAGAAILLAGRCIQPAEPKQSPIRLRRLCRIEIWSAVMFCVSAFFMFYKSAGRMDWLAFSLAGGVIQIYTSIMIPRERQKAAKSKKS